jgi:hypothetical protein
MSFDVKCPHCKRIYFETNDSGKRIVLPGKKKWVEDPRWKKYDPKAPFDPRMVVLKDPWKSWMWMDTSRQGDNMPLECPGCGRVIAVHGQTDLFKSLLRYKNKDAYKDWGPKKNYSDPRGRLSENT